MNVIKTDNTQALYNSLELIKEQQACIDKLVEALEEIAFGNTTITEACCANVANQALAYVRERNLTNQRSE